MSLERRRVLLVHGLGRTPLSLVLLARRLSREGYRPETFGYYAFAESHQRIVLRLARRLQILATTSEPVSLLGHSLGGLLLRQAAVLVPELRIHSLIMLGTPNQPPLLARRVRHWTAFRMLTRSCGDFLATPDAFATLAPPACRYLLIAGDAGWRGRWNPFEGAPNDGFVAVDETRIDPADSPVVLPVAHTFMMNSPAVQEAILEALGAGD